MNIIQHISLFSGISSSELMKFWLTAPHRYKTYKIPKRNKSGHRVIAQPSKEVKYFQYIASKLFFKKLPIHKSCTAYIKKSGIKENALKHSKNKYLLKMDFKDFFPSIKISDFILHVEKHIPNMSKENNIKDLSTLFFWSKFRNKELELSIGAPTSPHISNTILYDFDNMLYEYCESHSITYTRYADDMSFSTDEKDILFSIPEVVSSIIHKVQYPSLIINEDKTVFLSKKNNRHITGIVITNENKISLGRKRKRHIKSLVYKFIIGTLTTSEIYSLKGYLAFCMDIEPDFIVRLKSKYGENSIQNIFSYTSS